MVFSNRLSDGATLRVMRIDSEMQPELPLFDRHAEVSIGLLSAAIWVFDLESCTFIWANPAALDIWNSPSVAEFRQRDGTPQSVGVAQRFEVLRHELPNKREVREIWTIYPDGQPKPLDCRIRGVRLPDGHLAMMIEATPIDMGTQHVAELRLVEVINHIPVKLSLLTVDGRSLMHNPAARAWLHRVGLEEEFDGDLYLEMFEDRDRAQRMRRRALRTGFANGRILARGQGRRIHSLHLRRITDPLTGAFSLLVTRLDMTKTDQLERRLARALIHEQTISENQRHFLSLTSHEFRTPLAVIDSAARKILRLATEPLLLDRATKIRQSVSRMAAAIEKTLTASRIYEGKISFHPVETDLRDVVEGAVAIQREIAPTRQIHLANTALPRLKLDRALVEQCLDNLISNAIKYSFPDTAIEIDFRQGRRNISVIVSNMGIGIPEQDMPKLFDRFFRASNVHGVKGTGLGLHTVMYFMKLHGGTVLVRSREEGRTEVELCFPHSARGRARGGGPSVGRN